jgi:hypothetical protein
MGQIFGTASSALVWLGEDTNEDVEVAFGLLCDRNAHFEPEFSRLISSTLDLPTK